MQLTTNKILNIIKLFFLTVISSTRIVIISPMFIFTIIEQIQRYMETNEWVCLIIIPPSILMVFVNAITMERLRWKSYKLNIATLDNISSIYIPPAMSIYVILFGFIVLIMYSTVFIITDNALYLYASVINLWIIAYNVWSFIKYKDIKKQSNNIIIYNLGKDVLTVEFKCERGVFHEFNEHVKQGTD